MVEETWKEYTPEHEAKLEAQRQRRQAKREAEIQASVEEFERKQAEEKARLKARLEAQKAISQYVGEIGERLEVRATYLFSGWWEQRSFSGYGTETMYCHNFKDADGNVLVWKTTSSLGLDDETEVTIKGTVKAHSEYKGEKQTVLTRCKVSQ